MDYEPEKATHTDFGALLIVIFLSGLFGAALFGVATHLGTERIETILEGLCTGTGIIFGLFIGIISGSVIGTIVSFVRRNILSGLAIVVCLGIIGSIIGGIFYGSGLIVSSPIILAFASTGYAIGIPIAKKAEQRAEIKRKEKLKRERIRREQERKRKEQERRLKDIKSRYEQYKKEGYEPDKDLEKILKQ